MADKATKLYLLSQASKALVSIGLNRENATPDNISALNKALKTYATYYPKVTREQLPDNFNPLDMSTTVIDEIIKYIQNSKEKDDEEKKKPKEQEASIPPELESLVAEYEKNQALLESEEVKSNSQRSVAEQVKAAIAHHNNKKLAIANREKREKAGEKFKDSDSTFTELGSPKSENKIAALADSYKAVKEVAFTYSGFSKLPPELQNEIINSAVELNSIGVLDIDTAIQASTLQIDVSKLDEPVRNQLATIPGGFIATVYQEITTLDKKTAEYESKISENEQRIIKLQDELTYLPQTEREKIDIEIKNITDENEHLSDLIENQSTRLINLIAKQTELFKDFEKGREKRLSQDPDLKDRIVLANKKVALIYSNLESNGVQGLLFSSIDDADLLEKAIRHDMPGELNAHAGYQAEMAAALVNNPRTQDPDLSPQVILLYGKGLTPTLLAKARLFAINNPESELGKLFKTNQDLFNSASVQIRKIESSPLGKEITKVVSGWTKFTQPTTKFFSKISDKIPGGFGNLLRIAQDPVGAMQSWVGNKVGNYVLNKILTSTAGKAAIQAGTKIATELAKKGLGKAVASLAVKFGLNLALAGTIAGAPLALILIAIDVAASIFKAGVNAAQKVAVSIYGEKIKASEIIAVPVAVIGTGVVVVRGFVTTLATATVAAAGSGILIFIAGTLIGFFFYITSVAVAPLISTLVQLESTPKIRAVDGCAAWPTAGEHWVTQGPLGTATHAKNKLQAIDIFGGNVPIENTEFLVATRGVVSSTGPLGTYGNTAIIAAETEFGTVSMLYAHMNEVYLSAGQSVEAGDVVGSVGGTGGWDPHIHFEYIGFEYNNCPAGNIPVTEGCFLNCLYNGKTIITNVTMP